MIRTLLIAGTLLLFSNNTFAEYYSTDNVFQYPGNTVYAGGFARINDDVFITYHNGEAGRGVYAHNRQSGTKELVLRHSDPFYPYFPGGLWEPTFYPLTTGALIDIYGELFFTDGTLEGTQFIADFGIANTGGSLGYDRSRILNYIQAGRYFYVYQSPTYFPGENPDKDVAALWRVDLKNLTRTKLAEYVKYAYQENALDGQIISSNFVGSDEDGNAIMFAKRVNRRVGLLRLSPSSNQPDTLALFENMSDEEIEQGASLGIRSRAGLFFCRREGEEKSFWRLSNSGTLTRIAEACDSHHPRWMPLLARADEETIYFTKSERHELWSNSGTTGSSRLVKRLSPAQGKYERVCTSQGYVIAGTRLGRGYQKDVYATYVIARDGSERHFSDVVPQCAGGKVFLFDPFSDDIKYVYEPVESKFLKVYGISLSDRLIRYQEFSGDVYWLYRKSLGGRNYKDRIVNLTLKDGQYGDFMPGIMEVLLDDSSD